LKMTGGSFFLDFGYPYSKYRVFYEEYLKPRPGAGLLDLLVMGLLPQLEGIYRADLGAPKACGSSFARRALSQAG
jgi:ribonuclease J